MALAAAILFSGCVAPTDKYPLGEAPGPVYDTAEQIQAMPACKAVVVERGPCYVRLRTADGSGFFIGSPGAGAELVRFLESLKDGRSYKFPETFRKYREERWPASLRQPRNTRNTRKKSHVFSVFRVSWL